MQTLKRCMAAPNRSPEYSLHGKVSSKSDGDGSGLLLSSQLHEDMSEYILDSPLPNVPRNPTQWGVNASDIANLTAPDSDKDERGGQLTAPMRKNRRLFDTPRGTASAPAKRSRGASCSKVTRKSTKMTFKPHHDMDLNRADTVLFKFLFSDGHPLEETLVRMREYRLTRRQIQSLVPGREIDARVVEMVAMRNACSIQHLRHAHYWNLPPKFADDVIRGVSTEELLERYVPFWVKPSRYLDHIFVLVEDIFMHWWCMVIDFPNQCAYLLDSWPEPNMVTDREKLMRTMLGRLHEVMTSPAYGPATVYTPSKLPDWPIRRGQGIPKCNTSNNSASWVISWLHPERNFNPLQISGVLDDYILRGNTAVLLAGGTFNAIGNLVRIWAADWHGGV
ncbi:uncharacterized protein LOC130961944 isoform X1 [Arachis stenosperma]|uniref:uncharacterized protein LOC130961944 isoform X1 n=2 Tax=Arachis stenosperma TaxID=217475 RepID=UPI0025AC3B50|nr:uncharacterized protein LOC130961944 isoform X1 [Arachis stenosperma]